MRQGRIKTYDEYYDGGDYSIWLRHTPLIDVQLVEEGWGFTNYDLEEIQVNSASMPTMFAFSIDEPNQGIISRRSGGNVSIPFLHGDSNIHVIYTAGREDVPEDISLACLPLVAIWYRGLSSRRQRTQWTCPKVHISMTALAASPRSILACLSQSSSCCGRIAAAPSSDKETTMPHSPIGSPEYCREVKEESRKRILDSRARSGKLGDVERARLPCLRVASQRGDVRSHVWTIPMRIRSMRAGTSPLAISTRAATRLPRHRNPTGRSSTRTLPTASIRSTPRNTLRPHGHSSTKPNAAQYSVPELAKVRKAIISAAKSAGIQIADDGTSRSKGDGDWLSRRQEAELLAQHDAAMIRRYNERKAAMVGPDGPTYSERMRARELVNANSPEPRSVSHDYPHLPGRAATNR